MFADDIALYRIIKSAADYHQLQLDIDIVSSCIAGKYSMQVSAYKYIVIQERESTH